MNNNSIPVTLLTGYLGAGKTTLLNRILSEKHGKKYAVVVNEFGEVGIDNELIISSEEEVFEMNNGCICCTVRGDLIRILSGLLQRDENFEGILIETTGLADPGPVIQTFFVDDEIRDKVHLDQVVTVVDSAHFLSRIKDSHEAEEQVAFADLIIVNKKDLVNKDYLTDVSKKIRVLNNQADLIETVNCEVDLDKLLDRKSFSLDRLLKIEPGFMEEDPADHVHDETISSICLTCEEPLNPKKFSSWMQNLIREFGTNIFRSKGILYFENSNKQYVFQGVHMVMDSKWGPDWKDESDKVSKIVFIGRGLDAMNLKEGFDKCVGEVSNEQIRKENAV